MSARGHFFQMFSVLRRFVFRDDNYFLHVYIYIYIFNEMAIKHLINISQKKKKSLSKETD